MQYRPDLEINDSFHCKRSQSGEVIHIFSSTDYLMAVYSQRTGQTTWQRVIALTQRESVETWLRNNYPVLGAVKTVTVGKLKARAARQ
jgi:predicted transposase YdaD